MQIIKNDNFFMNLAINVARRNKGMTGANPSVGCVIVSRDKTIISIANTGIGGSPHAEKKALEGIEIKTGTVLYTTLEPCVHKGKNPPCVDEIINSGVKKVVIACLDKNPLVRGKGIKKLENSGIKVIKGVLEKDAEDFYDEFFKRINSNIPGINIKIASSADGKTALKNGKSKWITNKLSRNYGHKLRLFNDGIMVGINTILKDNPSLTCRLPGLTNFSPSRIVMDTNLKTTIHSFVHFFFNQRLSPLSSLLQLLVCQFAVCMCVVCLMHYMYHVLLHTRFDLKVKNSGRCIIFPQKLRLSVNANDAISCIKTSIFLAYILKNLL